MKSLSFALILLLSLVGCSSTRYEYRLPDNEAGKTCVLRCEVAQAGCQQAISEAENSCRMQQNLQAMMNRCQSKDGKTIPCATPFNACQFSTNACKQTFNSCYQNCGGQVIEIRD